MKELDGTAQEERFKEKLEEYKALIKSAYEDVSNLPQNSKKRIQKHMGIYERNKDSLSRESWVALVLVLLKQASSRFLCYGQDAPKAINQTELMHAALRLLMKWQTTFFHDRDRKLQWEDIRQQYLGSPSVELMLKFAAWEVEDESSTWLSYESMRRHVAALYYRIFDDHSW